MRTVAVFQLLCLLSLIPGRACNAADTTAAPSWRVAAREDWVLDAPAAAPDAAPRTGLLLHDRQIRITAAGDDRYEHTILRLTGADTGEDAAQVYIELDPRFQELVVHSLRLAHGTAPSRAFSAAQIRSLVRIQAAEVEPHKRELNPRLQLSVQVPDARPGDLVECEYTVHSQSARWPALLAGHYAARWPVGADQPVRQERLHVTWPAGRPVQFRLSGTVTAPAPRVQTHAGELDIQWRDLQPVASEEDTPRWFERRDVVQLSDFGTWPQVAALLAPEYDTADRMDPPPPAATAAPDMILNALRLVQSKVHAVNVAVSGPYAPADPALVLQRGYGDTRDLARLLASLLRRVGIDAQVALADSHRGALLASSLPSPYLLDAGLVLARAGTTEYWINPAAVGPAALSTTDPADLRQALIIAPSGGRIVPLPPPPPDAMLRSITQQFDLRGGANRPATLTVMTLFHGTWAQSVRADLLAQSAAQLRLAQIQSVMQDYPTAVDDGGVQVQDLPARQSVQLIARFRLPNVLGAASDPHMNFFAEGLAEVVQPRDETTRQFPLGLAWPLQLEEHIVAALPAGFEVPDDKIVIENPAFRYQRQVRFTRGILHIDHIYVARSDHVDPVDYAKFLTANAQVYRALALRVQPAGFSWRRDLDWRSGRGLEYLLLAAVVATLLGIGWHRLRRP